VLLLATGRLHQGDAGQPADAGHQGQVVLAERSRHPRSCQLLGRGHRVDEARRRRLSFR